MNNYREVENPIVVNMERTGYPDGKTPQVPICPICGEECDTIYYKVRYGDVLGCENCIMTGDAWGENECFPGKE